MSPVATAFFYIFQVFQVYQILMVIWVFSSWFPEARDVGLVRFIGRLVEPYLNVFRRIIPPLGGLDISVLVAFFFFRWGMNSLVQLIMRYL